MFRVFIYLRKSTDREDKQQLSLESQRLECESLCTREWFEVIEIFEEVLSAKIEETRPKFQAMIDRCKKWEADGIVAWKLDRLSRNPIDGAKLQTIVQRGQIQKVHTVSDGVFGKQESTMMMAVILSFANHYVMKLAEDIKRGMLTKFRKGQFVTRWPRGYKKDENNTWVVDPVEAEQIQEIFDLRVNKWWTTHAIAEHVRAKDILKSDHGWKSNNFTRKSVEQILRTKTYYGLMHFWWEVIMNKAFAIVDKNLWDRANTVFKAVTPREQFPFKWLVKDMHGNILSASESTGRMSKVVYYHGRWAGAVRISEKKIIEYFDQCIDEFEISREITQIIIDGSIQETKNIIKDNERKRMTLMNKKKAINKKMDGYLDMRANGEISAEQFKKSNEENHAELLEIDEALKLIQDVNIDLLTEASEIVEPLINIVQHYKNASFEKKRDIIKILAVELILDNKKALCIRKNEVFELSKALKVCNGAIDRARTYDLLLRREAL